MQGENTNSVLPAKNKDVWLNGEISLAAAANKHVVAGVNAALRGKGVINPKTKQAHSTCHMHTRTNVAHAYMARASTAGATSKGSHTVGTLAPIPYQGASKGLNIKGTTMHVAFQGLDFVGKEGENEKWQALRQPFVFTIQQDPTPYTFTLHRVSDKFSKPLGRCTKCLAPNAPGICCAARARPERKPKMAKLSGKSPWESAMEASLAAAAEPEEAHTASGSEGAEAVESQSPPAKAT